jgi:hypothetical protein
MSIKNKLLNIVTAHPKAVTLAMGLGVTLAVGAAIGTLDNSHMAMARVCIGCTP